MIREPINLPCVLTIDIGTSSVRVILFDQTGKMVSSIFRNTYNMKTSSDGGIYINADYLEQVVCSVIDEFCSAGGHPPIDHVAMTTFWHNVVGVRDEQAITPLISWADTRPDSILSELGERFDQQSLHQRTGCVLHASYLPAKICWFEQKDAKQFKQVERWMSISEYLFLKWFGTPTCSISMASGSGLFNQHVCDWDDETLDALPITRSQLTELCDIDEPVHGLMDSYASRWPILAEASWYPAIGDGASNNIGSGCYDDNRIALMVGTSGAMRVMRKVETFTIPNGLWCYRLDRRRTLFGGALSNGGNIYNWLSHVLSLSNKENIEEALSTMSPDNHGITVLPFWAGERSPGWHSNATASITGMTLHTTPLDIMQASLESTAFCFANIYNRLCSSRHVSGEIVASGAGLLQSPTWLQMLADILEQPITASSIAEASSRGAALVALEASGILEDISLTSVPRDKTYKPDLSKRARYRKALKRHKDFYDMMMDS